MTIDKPTSNPSADSVSPIEFWLDGSSGVPTYLQLVQQVDQALRLGYLRQGDQLPRVKDVTAGLGINPNTVLKAYRELEQRGLAKGRPGQGTFITERTGEGVIQFAELDGLRADLRVWLGRAAEAGLDDESIAALVRRGLRELRRGVA